MIPTTILTVLVRSQLRLDQTRERLGQRIEALATDDRGEVSSTVIMIGVMCALAVAVGAILYQKFVAKANSTPTGN